MYPIRTCLHVRAAKGSDMPPSLKPDGMEKLAFTRVIQFAMNPPRLVAL